MSKEINGRYSDSDREWLEAVAGKRKIDPYEWDNLLSNAMANRILDYIAELKSLLEETAENGATVGWRVEERLLSKRIAEIKKGE